MISRRLFAKLAAIASVAPLTPSSGAAEGGGAPPSSAEVEARIQWIINKYGAHLNEQERADIRRIVAGGQSAVDDMRKYDLANSVEPAELFRIYRKAAKQ